MIKSLAETGLVLNQIISLRVNFISRLLENLREENFRDSIWSVDLADMQSLNKYKGIKYLLCAIDLFSKSVWVVSLKDKRGINIVNAGGKYFRRKKIKQNMYELIKVVNLTISFLRDF